MRFKKTRSSGKIYPNGCWDATFSSRAFSDPASMQLTRRIRSILFMEVRGFTRIGPKAAPPKKWPEFLTRYYLKNRDRFTNPPGHQIQIHRR